MIETALHQLITSDPRFSDLAGTRLYPLILPDKEILPAASYQTISTTPLYTLDTRVNLTRYRIEIDTFASTYAGAKTLARTVEQILDSVTDPAFDSITLDSSSDQYEQSNRVYRVIADFIIQYAEPAS